MKLTLIISFFVALLIMALFDVIKAEKFRRKEELRRETIKNALCDIAKVGFEIKQILSSYLNDNNLPF